MIPNGLANFYTIDDATRQKTFELGQRGGSITDNMTEADGGDKKRKWAVGEIDFEALMRMLDNAVSLQKLFNSFYLSNSSKLCELKGYRTGYVYKQPLVKEELSKPKNDVEVPAAVSSLGYFLEEDQLYKDWLVSVKIIDYK